MKMWESQFPVMIRHFLHKWEQGASGNQIACLRTKIPVIVCNCTFFQKGSMVLFLVKSLFYS